MQILVVDDSKTIRFMLMRLLNELGYDQISEAADVDAALFQIQVKPPDLIFSDFNMPGKNGLDFLKAIRLHPTLAQVPFIMVTTMHDKKLIFDAVKAGLQFYILKPVEKNVLIEKLTALSESHHIQPPRKVAVAGRQAPEPEKAPDVKAESSEHKEAITPEQIDAIAEHFFLVFDGELTMQDFMTWATENIMSHLPKENKIKSPQQLLDVLRSSALDGIKVALKHIDS